MVSRAAAEDSSIRFKLAVEKKNLQAGVLGSMRKDFSKINKHICSELDLSDKRGICVFKGFYDPQRQSAAVLMSESSQCCRAESRKDGKVEQEKKSWREEEVSAR